MHGQGGSREDCTLCQLAAMNSRAQMLSPPFISPLKNWNTLLLCIEPLNPHAAARGKPQNNRRSDFKSMVQIRPRSLSHTCNRRALSVFACVHGCCMGGSILCAFSAFLTSLKLYNLSIFFFFIRHWKT